jgi:hypothetical protein
LQADPYRRNPLLKYQPEFIHIVEEGMCMVNSSVRLDVWNRDDIPYTSVSLPFAFRAMVLW